MTSLRAVQKLIGRRGQWKCGTRSSCQRWQMLNGADAKKYGRLELFELFYLLYFLLPTVQVT